MADNGISGGTVAGLLGLGVAGLVAYHFKDQISAAWGSAAKPAPPPSATPEAVSVAAVAAPPPAGTPPAPLGVHTSKEAHPPGSIVVTQMTDKKLGKVHQSWLVGPDGHQMTPQGLPLPASDPSAPPLTSRAAPPIPRPGPAAPTSPLAGLPLPPAAQQALGGLPPQATQALGAAAKLLGQGGASSPLGQASSALSGLLGGGGKGGAGGAPGAVNALSGALTTGGSAATKALSSAFSGTNASGDTQSLGDAGSDAAGDVGDIGGDL